MVMVLPCQQPQLDAEHCLAAKYSFWVSFFCVGVVANSVFRLRLNPISLPCPMSLCRGFGTLSLRFRVGGADLRRCGEGLGSQWHPRPRGVDAVLGAVRGAGQGLPTVW